MAQKFIGVTLPVRLGKTGMFEQSTTIIEQVRSNFKNLILTKKGERIGQPELGCDLWKVLFDPMENNILERARATVVEAVDRWLPFIQLIDFQITKTDVENTLEIKCLYQFRSNPNVTDLVSISTQTLAAPNQQFGITTRTTRVANGRTITSGNPRGFFGTD